MVNENWLHLRSLAELAPKKRVCPLRQFLLPSEPPLLFYIIFGTVIRTADVPSYFHEVVLREK